MFVLLRASLTESDLCTNVSFFAVINGSPRYWLPFHANECIFSRNEQ